MARPEKYADPSRRIDLSLPRADVFQIIQGRCLRCKGARPLLKEINMCKICIIDSIAVGCDVILPVGFRVESKQKENCPICLQDIKYEQTRIACSECPQLFHADCLATWAKASLTCQCPVCCVEWENGPICS